MGRKEIEKSREELLSNYSPAPNDKDGWVICDRCGYKTFANVSGNYSNLWEHEESEH